MDSTEKQADTPADINPASDVSPAPIENTSAQTEAQPSASEPVTRPRLSESQFESEHAELPPLSSIPAAGAAIENTAETADAPAESRTQARRGIGRSNGSRNGKNQPQSSCGVVENPGEITENLSGKFAGGYGDRPENRERRRDRETPAATTETAETGPNEFVPPVSQGSFKAEMNPERERQAREEKRRDRQPFGKTDSAGNRERREQGRDWTPTQRNDGKPGERNPRQKLLIEPAKMPVQPSESLFEKIKKFFGNLFGMTGKTKAKTGDKKFGERDDKRGERGRGQYRDQRGHGRGRGGEFRHGNRGGKQNFSRGESHRRPHSHNANRHDNKRGGE